jgi:hypothetical protein
MAAATPSEAICLACGAVLTPALGLAGSTRCQDCRDARAVLRAELLARQRLTARPADAA